MLMPDTSSEWKGCEAPDCDYPGMPDNGLCWAHGLGRAPLISFDRYWAWNHTHPLHEWVDSFGQYSTNALRLRKQMGLDTESPGMV